MQKQPTGNRRQQGLWPWVLRYGFRRWPGIVSVLALMLLKIAFDLLKPWPMKVLVDQALVRRADSAQSFLLNIPKGMDQPESLIFWCALATVIIFLLSRAAHVFSTLINVGFGRRLSFDVAEDLFSHLQRLSLQFHHRSAAGDHIHRIARDSTCASTLVKDAAIPFLTSLIMLAAMFVILYKLNVLLTLVALAVVPLLYLVLRLHAEPMLRWSVAQSEKDSGLYTMLEETFSSMPVVQAFTREQIGDRQFHRLTGESTAIALSNNRVQVQFKFLVGLLTAAGSATILWLGAHQVMQGSLSVGSFLVFLSYLAMLYGPLESLAYTSTSVQGARAGAIRVREILEAEPEVRDPAHPRTIGTIKGQVTFDQVTFGYDPGAPVLHGIRLDVRPGESIALVGQTGAGKTTLVGLLMRFFDPQTGAIQIDGMDIREWRLGDLRARIAIVPQDIFLFPTTIAENIAYGRPTAGPADIQRAAEAACADDFIRELPQGYDTVVGQTGATLSVGQRQRIAIARALLKDAPILVLDEPTSAVDARTDSLLSAALSRLMKGRTTFIIAHRLMTIERAHRIVVLDRGRIAAQGTREDVMQTDRFQKLFQMQNAMTGSEGGSKA